MRKRRRRKHRQRICRLAALVGAAVLFFLPLTVLPRAGGGDRFPAFDGGGGGESSGDDGVLTLLVWLALYSPIPVPCKIGIVLAILIGAALMRRRGVRRRATPPLASHPPVVYAGTGTGAAAPPTASTAATQLEELRKRDPLFSQQAFEDTVSTAFIKIQEAWSKRDMSIARPFITPSLLLRFQSQIDELKRMGRTNHVEQAAIASVDIVEVSQDGGYDYITARIVAAAADYTTDDRTGQIVAGTKTIRQFTEYWTFLRSDRVKTRPAKEEVVSKHCPNCGAPLQLTAVGRCEYCGSDVTSGDFSWVLSEITQASAWRPRAQARRPDNISPLSAERYVLGLVVCPGCGANVQDIAGITTERCWRCGGTVLTER